jgi:hypothetical protein
MIAVIECPFCRRVAGTVGRDADRGLARENLLLRRPLCEEPPDQAGNLLLDERHDVVELLEPVARRRRAVGGGGEAALGDLPHLAVDRTGAREHRVERIRRCAEILASVAGPGRPADQAGRGEDARSAADRPAARLERG